MERLSIDRRRFLKSALTAGAYLAAASGPASRPAVAARVKPFSLDGESARRLPALNISRDRIIRTVVGLRPYRSEGFVLAPERLGEKMVVHNYGHGGAGVTLSWGVATLNSLYMFPRRNGIVLGGSFEADNQSLEADAKTTARIIDGNAEIAKGLRH